MAKRPVKTAPRSGGYSARDIEVLEGLEPVRRRPAMYIGGSDERAMYHLAAEALDNAMDEAVAGHASWIDIDLAADGTVTVRDNGRGIPVDPHPKFKNKSALEVVMTTLHSGGKFSNKVYDTSGGLHGVGLSVVNALSDRLTIEVARDKGLWTQDYVRGRPEGKLKKHKGEVRNRRGTTVIFHPDAEIFGARAHFRPAPLYRMARSKAYLFRGVEIRWSCDKSLLKDDDDIPPAETLHFPGGLRDYLESRLAGRACIIDDAFFGTADMSNGHGGRVEWAVAWPEDGDGALSSYCNTVPTPQGGTHETGLRNALTRGLKAYAELVGSKRASIITADDVVGGAWGVLSVFIANPEFQGQTKEKLSTTGVTRLVEAIPRPPMRSSTASTRAPRNGCAGARKGRWRARRRRARRACRASWPTAPAAHPKAPRSSWWKAIPPAGRPNRRASGISRRCCRCGARFSTWPARRRRRCAPTRSSPI